VWLETEYDPSVIGQKRTDDTSTYFAGEDEFENTVWDAFSRDQNNASWTVFSRYTLGMLKVLLIRHADPVKPSALHTNEYTRPLTPEGVQDALKLVETLKNLEIDAAYSSPYLRAIQTIEPVAQARALKIQTIEDLREHALGPGLIDHWREARGRTSISHFPAAKLCEVRKRAA
jgi:Histidine phosphatase superfamily (branch 1)